MSNYFEERLLVITKTYPTPSQSYRETVCVAAINENKELRRLYPILYRYLEGNQQFNKWQWIRAKITKSSDRRPESYIIDNDTIHLEEKINTKNSWSERMTYIQQSIYPNFSDLENDRLSNRISLGIIKPFDLTMEIKSAKNKEWSDKQLTALRKDGLFDVQAPVSKPLVKKLPVDVYYSFFTENDPKRYRFMVTDWESGALYWRCVREYSNEWEVYFRKKLEIEFQKKDLHLLMGTMHQYPDQWLIIGLVYPPRGSRQPYLF